ncbi:MAG: TniQ family protein [Ralstonia sp.]|jgi:DNA-binding phage protein|uniref:TniQ domain-containing protein n=1 Tax=Ralstonia pickettii TaxID=329 RepID=A0ABM9ITB5_RALPI|nr:MULTISPECIES: TniQ family protein [Ralstonia]MBA4201545.1 TetR family transcriptional regulator [Ralstonia sp.]MBA4232195.1 TetR family transcriptional regulator [Ralstonia sp.]MBA4236294.1 TetR family transcriptional regulator [Ralstonia sp.]MBA4403240.1 TetR family transcriptional regulator [Ralstonia sp.]MCL6469660.1 TniQ family protein [Ralstonia sp.]
MSPPLSNPRSVLHALTPIGVGTPGVESLLSYLCRLAVSHAVSVTELSRKIAKTVGWELSDNYNWKRLHLNGNGEAARNWSGALSALTSIEQLDQLTLLPWADVIAQQSLTTTSARWCSQCLAEDLASGCSPYLRTAWDVGCVTACSRHRTQLVHVCPDCGRTDARHRFAYVVPGWCAHCGAFLGGVEHGVPAAPEEIWKASQVGEMLAVQATLESVPTRESLHDCLRELVARLDHGKSAAFARRIGLSKGTVHHWLKDGGIPALPAHLRIASQTGLSLAKLLAGDLTDWSPATAEIHQLAFLFPRQSQRVVRRTLDWCQIRAELTAMGRSLVPVSVAEAARRLDIDVRQLYQNANKEARILAERWRQYMRRRGEQSIANAREAIDVACQDIASQDKAINLREVKERVPQEVLGSVRGVISLLQDAKGRITTG